MKKIAFHTIKLLTTGLLLISINSCEKTSDNSNIDSNKRMQSINDLERRISKLELQLGKKSPKTIGLKTNAPEGPIKSMTFRLGTKDDRLRIYWADGSSSDLPCTKEQSIWACG